MVQLTLRCVADILIFLAEWLASSPGRSCWEHPDLVGSPSLPRRLRYQQRLMRGPAGVGAVVLR